MALYPVLLALRAWGDRYMAPDGPPMYYRRRGDCGGEAHVHLHCDAWHQELSARDVNPEPGPGMASVLADANA